MENFTCGPIQPITAAQQMVASDTQHSPGTPALLPTELPSTTLPTSPRQSVSFSVSWLQWGHRQTAPASMSHSQGLVALSQGSTVLHPSILLTLPVSTASFSISCWPFSFLGGSSWAFFQELVLLLLRLQGSDGHHGHRVLSWGSMPMVHWDSSAGALWEIMS